MGQTLIAWSKENLSKKQTLKLQAASTRYKSLNYETAKES